MALETNFYNRPGQQVSDNSFKSVGNNPYNVMTATPGYVSQMRQTAGQGRELAKQQSRVNQINFRNQVGQANVQRQTAVVDQRSEIIEAVELARQDVEMYREQVKRLIKQQQDALRDQIEEDVKSRMQYNADFRSEGIQSGVGTAISGIAGVAGAAVSQIQDTRAARQAKEMYDQTSKINLQIPEFGEGHQLAVLKHLEDYTKNGALPTTQQLIDDMNILNSGIRDESYLVPATERLISRGISPLTDFVNPSDFDRKNLAYYGLAPAQSVAPAPAAVTATVSQPESISPRGFQAPQQFWSSAESLLFPSSVPALRQLSTGPMMGDVMSLPYEDRTAIYQNWLRGQ